MSRHGINAAADVGDVAVLKAAHDMHDGVHFADVAEEFVAEAFALARAFHEAGDVHELDGGGDSFEEPEILESTARRSSGTVTTPVFGSMVQKG
jgi:hypothetical protein